MPPKGLGFGLANVLPSHHCLSVFCRALRALKQCRLDREKLMLWRWWLGLPAEPDPDLDLERAYIKNDWLDPVAPEAAVAAPNKRASGVDSGSWGEGDKRPRLEDMRDLVEGRVSAFFLVQIRRGLGRGNVLCVRSFEGVVPASPVAASRCRSGGFARARPEARGVCAQMQGPLPAPGSGLGDPPSR